MRPGAPTVTVYTLRGCVHCVRARRRLRRHRATFTELRGDGEPGFRRRLVGLTGSATVPQVVIGGEPVGGADDLAHLDRRGVLAPLLEGRPFPHPVVRRTAAPWRFDVELRGADGRTIRTEVAGVARKEAIRVAEELTRRAGPRHGESSRPRRGSKAR
jgi:glutaredoxin 3